MGTEDFDYDSSMGECAEKLFGIISLARSVEFSNYSRSDVKRWLREVKSATADTVESFKSKTRDYTNALADSVFSPSTRKHRKMILLTSAILLTMIWIGIIPSEISAIGVKFDKTSQQTLVFGAMTVVIYFYTMFLVIGTAEMNAWETSCDLQLTKLNEVRRRLALVITHELPCDYSFTSDELNGILREDRVYSERDKSGENYWSEFLSTYLQHGRRWIVASERYLPILVGAIAIASGLYFIYFGSPISSRWITS